MEQPNSNTSLEWKSHNEYFTDYSIIKKEYNKLYSSCILDLNNIKFTYAKLFEFIGHIKGQLLIKLSDEDIKKERNKILELISKKQNIKALDAIDEFYNKIIVICRELELEPKPEEEIVDEIKTEKDDKIKAALMAYELIYEK